MANRELRFLVNINEFLSFTNRKIKILKPEKNSHTIISIKFYSKHEDLDNYLETKPFKI